MKKKFGLMGIPVLALVFGTLLSGCATQFNNLLQPTQELGTKGIDSYTVLGAVSIVSVGTGALATPLSYGDLLEKAQSIYGADKVSKVISIQINSYEKKLLGFISISRRTEMAGLAVAD